ncbi:MAG: multiheme c-type cytochrome [Candidatus Omnitrophota bacterium]
MNGARKTTLLATAALVLPCAALLSAQATFSPKELTPESAECIECHKVETPSIYDQWGSSKHYRANVGCYECHMAEEGDKDAFQHNIMRNDGTTYKGKRISIIVSPRDCARCHEKEVEQFTNSHHAKAGRIMGSLDNTLAEVVEGNNGFTTTAFPKGVSAAAVNGCWQCHGSEVRPLEGGKLDPATWPNTGIGRINPDGSEGSCTACHSRHAFSAAQARHPENCGKCHMGPDHPQIEIYNESKHGVAFRAHINEMNLDNAKWVLGEDYSAAPTCSTCHMSATSKQPVTHDVGMRISWNNRPAISIRPETSDKKMGLPGAAVNWETRRMNMIDVCSNCHNSNFIKGFYEQYDGLIQLYHEKFASPGLELMALAKPLLRPAEFSNKIDFTWFEIWHHEGRRARHGASMMGPDITHWHGTYEVARNFYSEFIPELQELVEKGLQSGDDAKITAAKALDAQLKQLFEEDNHRWYENKLSLEEKAERLRRQQEFQARYAK